MFVPYIKNSLSEVSEVDFDEANTFLSLNPLEWCAPLIETWQPFLDSLDLTLTDFDIKPDTQISNSELLSFCFTVDENDSFLFIPKDQLKKNFAFLNFGTDFNQVIFVVVEYFVRKFLFDVNRNWKGFQPSPQFQFVGFESNLEMDEGQKRFLKGVVKLDKFDLDFFVVLPDEFLNQILNEIPASNVLNDYLNSTVPSDTLLCRFDISSFSIPTEELIDFVRSGKVIDLPARAKPDEIQISVENEIKAFGKLQRIGNQLVVSLEKDREQEKFDSIPLQTTLTISLGVKEFSQEELARNPRYLKLDDVNFPEVNLIISREIIAQGILGLNELGNLCVRVS